MPFSSILVNNEGYLPMGNIPIYYTCECNDYPVINKKSSQFANLAKWPCLLDIDDKADYKCNSPERLTVPCIPNN